MKKIAIRLIGAVLILGSLAIAWAGMELYRFKQTPLNVSEAGQLITVKPGSNLSRIAHELEARGVIDSALYLRLWSRWLDQATAIHAGEYELTPGMLPLALLENMVNGKVIQYSLTIIEGWSFKQLMAALSQHEKIRTTLQGLNNEEIMARLGHEGQHPEGRFLPDTYHFPAGTSDANFLKRAYEAMAQRLAAEWQQREENLPLKTPYEALILASIIEKETAVASERAEIAGVFVRRLQRNMRLQTDPTVIYGMGDAFDGNIRRRDLRRDTPYNTYTRKGLPPTPIAMPSGEAIHAALHPKPGSSLYFVAKGDGSHYFSGTIDEHNRAVRRYQLNKSR